MDLLDFWIFSHTLNKNINKICKLICSVNFVGNNEVTYMEPQTVPSYMSIKYVRQTLRMPNFTHAPHTQPFLSNISKWDLNFDELACSRGMTRLGRNFPTSPQNQNTKLTHCLIYMSIRTKSFPQTK